MVADVPLGALLSGGIDSSLVTALMQEASNRPVKTFSIGFEEESFSELDKARTVARLLEVDHRDQVVRGDLLETLPRVIDLCGEPFADSSVLPFFYLARFARQQVTVCLSGDGGDEILAGYETYKADRLHHLLRWAPRSLTGSAGFLVRALWPVSFDKVSFDYKLRQFLTGQNLDFHHAHHHWRTIFSRDQKRSLLRPGYRDLADSDGFDCFAQYFGEVGDCHYLDQAMFVDIKTWLVDDILVKVDRATMAHSLEARAPFLDHRLVELAASPPVEWKLRRLDGKYLLKRAHRQSLPKGILRQRKSGFNAPVSQWLNGPFGAAARQLIDTSPVVDWVIPEAVHRLWEEHRGKIRDHGLRLFGLTCLALWMREAA